ncbi:insulinase family protein [Brucella abortus]|nr:insulinase family protein [Brucella abortus]
MLKARRWESGKGGARVTKPPDRHGIAHLLEHMAAKGTENRTAWQIASDD